MSAVPIDAVELPPPPIAAPPAAVADPQPVTLVAPPTPGELALGILGFGLMGAVAGIGSGFSEVALRSSASMALLVLGSNLITGPALLVAHQFLALDARPEALVGAIANGVATAGRVALGLVAPVLFFSATTSMWAPTFLLAVQVCAVFGFRTARFRLVEAEMAAGPTGVLKMRLLVQLWSALTWMVALRVAWDLVWFVVHPILFAWSHP